MFSWLDARDAQKFGTTLAEYVIGRLPLEKSRKKNKSMLKKELDLDKMFLQLQLFKSKHKLNFYQKAKLGNAFKWKLLEANYDPAFVAELTKVLLLRC